MLNGTTLDAESITSDKMEGSSKSKTGDAAVAANAVLKPSIPMPSSSTQIRGVDFNEYSKSPITVKQLTSHFTRTGFQASSIGRAVEIINNMVSLRDGPRNNDSETGNQETFPLILTTRTKNLHQQTQNALSS
jgi:deoxyhypusine synthase